MDGNNDNNTNNDHTNLEEEWQRQSGLFVTNNNNTNTNPITTNGSNNNITTNNFNGGLISNCNFSLTLNCVFEGLGFDFPFNYNLGYQCMLPNLQGHQVPNFDYRGSVNPFPGMQSMNPFPRFPIYQGPIYGNEGSISNFSLSLNCIRGFRV